MCVDYSENLTVVNSVFTAMECVLTAVKISLQSKVFSQGVECVLTAVKNCHRSEITFHDFF